MTRPRSIGSAASWSDEFTPAANVTLAAPSGTSATACHVSVGAMAASSSAPPNSAALSTISRGLTRPRAPVASAPSTEPTPITAVSVAYVAAVPSHVSLASSGSRTWKLNDSVPTSTIITSGIRSAGVARTYLRAARSCPGSRGARSARSSRPGSIRRSATSMTTNEPELTAKQAETPSSAISAPAAAGPTMREEWTMTELSATALSKRSGPTISLTNACRAGLSTASTVPRTSTSA
jgi:hypothetical protein